MPLWLTIAIAVVGLVGGPILTLYVTTRKIRQEEEVRRAQLATDNLDRANRAFDMYTQLVEDLERRIKEADKQHEKETAVYENRKAEWEEEREALKRRIQELEREIYKLRLTLQKEGVSIIE